MSETEKNRILAKRLRNNIIGVLELWSSKEVQIKYQKEVPIAQVSSKLFNQWETFFDPESEQLHYGFSSNEKSILMDFNSLINHILNKSYDIPYITEFVETKDWKLLNEAAIDTLNRIEKNKI